tara:strand:+ start:303 stop:587 length:285 start_codon:yes stop_codon:yes gene_type:complete
MLSQKVLSLSGIDDNINRSSKEKEKETSSASSTARVARIGSMRGEGGELRSSNDVQTGSASTTPSCPPLAAPPSNASEKNWRLGEWLSDCGTCL